MSALVAFGMAASVLLLYDGLSLPRRTWGPARSIVGGGPHTIGGGRLAALSLSSAILGTVIVVSISGSLAAGTVAGLSGAWLPSAIDSGRARRRARESRAAWPDALATLIASIRAGVSLPAATSELADRAAPVIAPGFVAFRATYRATGSFPTGLESLRTRLGDPVADRVAVALGIAHEVGGGDLVRVLRTLSDQVRGDIHLRTEIESRWSWTVTAARLAAAAPWIVLALMVTRPEGSQAYASPAGSAVLAAGALSTVVGYRLMLRAGRLPEERRLG